MKDLGLESTPLNCWAAGIMLGLVQILAMGLFKPLGVSQQFVEADAAVIEKVLKVDKLDGSAWLRDDGDTQPVAYAAAAEPRTLVTTLSRSGSFQWGSSSPSSSSRPRPTTRQQTRSTSSATIGDSTSRTSRADYQPALAESSEQPVGQAVDGLLGRSVAQWRRAVSDEKVRDGVYDRWFVIGIPIGAVLAVIQLRRRRLRVTTAWSRANSRSGPAGRAAAAFCGGFLALFGAAIARGALTGQFVSAWTQLSVSAAPFTVGMIVCGLLVAYMAYPQTPGRDEGGF